MTDQPAVPEPEDLEPEDLLPEDVGELHHSTGSDADTDEVQQAEVPDGQDTALEPNGFVPTSGNIPYSDTEDPTDMSKMPGGLY